MQDAFAHRLPIDALYDRVRRELVDSWRFQLLGTDLLPIQTRAVNELGILGDHPHPLLTICSPPGTGKTALAEMIGSKAAFGGGRTLLVTPPVHQTAVRTFGELRGRYDWLKIEVVLSSGETKRFDRQIFAGEYGMAVITLDKLPAFLGSELVENVDVVIADDLDLLGDGHEPMIEQLIELAQASRRPPRMVGFFSAEKPARAYSSWYRTQLLVDHSLPMERSREARLAGGGDAFPGDGPAVLLTSALNIAHRGRQQVVTVVREAHDSTSLALILASRSHLRPATHTIEGLTAVDPTPTLDVLRKVLGSGIGFLNHDMSEREHHAVDQGFRSGDVRILVTSINQDWMPSSGAPRPRVILFDPASELLSVRGDAWRSGPQRPSSPSSEPSSQTNATTPHPPEKNEAVAPGVAKGAVVDLTVDLRRMTVELRGGRSLASTRDISRKRLQQLAAIARRAPKLVTVEDVAEDERIFEGLKSRPTPEDAANLRYELLRKVPELEELIVLASQGRLRFAGRAKVIGLEDFAI